MDARVCLERYGEILRQYPAPMPPEGMAVIMAHESGGNPRATARGRSFDEVGLLQLVITHSDRTGNGDAKLADVDPWDPASNIYGAQAEYSRIKQHLTSWFPDAPYTPHADRDVDAWLVLMKLGRSVGVRGTKTLLEAARGLGHYPLEALQSMAESHQNLVPQLGGQSKELVLRRLQNALAFPAQARALGQLPETIGALPPRGSELVAFPSDFMERLGRA